MPKKPSIDQETIASLQKLQTQIEAAEKLLSKMPGARKASVSLYELDPRSEDYHGYSSTLQYWTSGIYVVTETPQSLADDFCEPDSERLKDLSTARRIEVSKFIPKLIKEAKAQEAKLRESCDDATAMIEQAIAESMEGE